MLNRKRFSRFGKWDHRENTKFSPHFHHFLRKIGENFEMTFIFTPYPIDSFSFYSKNETIVKLQIFPAILTIILVKWVKTSKWRIFSHHVQLIQFHFIRKNETIVKIQIFSIISCNSHENGSIKSGKCSFLHHVQLTCFYLIRKMWPSWKYTYFQRLLPIYLKNSKENAVSCHGGQNENVAFHFDQFSDILNSIMATTVKIEAFYDPFWPFSALTNDNGIDKSHCCCRIAAGSFIIPCRRQPNPVNWY